MSSSEQGNGKTHCTDEQASPCLCGYKMSEFCECDTINTTTNTTNMTRTSTNINHSQLSYEELSNIRIRQKNLVYVVGLPINLCDEQTLRTNKWFGSFGKIKKIYCNKKTSHVSRTGSFAAFITFYRESDAIKAINNMNGKYLEDGHRIIKATTGSTKYCSYFLRNTICNNPQCLYLHEWAHKYDVVTKQELNDFGPINTINTIIHSSHKRNQHQQQHHHQQHQHHHSSIQKNKSSISSISSISSFDYTKKHRTKPPITHITHKKINVNATTNANENTNANTNTNKLPVAHKKNNNKKKQTCVIKKNVIRKNNKKSYRKVAKLLLHELMRNNKDNKNNHSINPIKFKMSDLLKDGMLTCDELKMIEMDQYNYYYFLQSDKLIFQQFHKLQFTQKLQKSKA